MRFWQIVCEVSHAFDTLRAEALSKHPDELSRNKINRLKLRGDRSVSYDIHLKMTRFFLCLNESTRRGLVALDLTVSSTFLIILCDRCRFSKVSFVKEF